MPLTAIRQSGGKIVHAFPLEGDADPETIRSNSFEIEWPPRSGRRQVFPEVDRAAWFALEEARQKINPAQIALLDEVQMLLS